MDDLKQLKKGEHAPFRKEEENKAIFFGVGVAAFAAALNNALKEEGEGRISARSYQMFESEVESLVKAQNEAYQAGKINPALDHAVADLTRILKAFDSEDLIQKASDKTTVR